MTEIATEYTEQPSEAGTTESALFFDEQAEQAQKPVCTSAADTKELEDGGVLPSLTISFEPMSEIKAGATAPLESTSTQTVAYPNGEQRTFTLNESGTISGIKETDGSDWKLEADGKFHQYKNGKATGSVNEAKPSLNAAGDYTITNKDGSFEVRKADGSTVAHNSQGRVTQVTHPDGGKTTVTYNSNGDIDRITEADGTTWIRKSDFEWYGFTFGGGPVKNDTMIHDVDSQGNHLVRMKDGSMQIHKPDGTMETRPAEKLPLYGNPDNPLASIVPSAVDQGNIGNCYFMAALAAVADTDPQAIKEMIKDNGDGTYTVTFPGDKDHPVRVYAPTPEEMATFAGTDGEHGIWSAVIEKAFREKSGSTYNDRGNTVGYGLQILTGQNVNVTDFTFFSLQGVVRGPDGKPLLGVPWPFSDTSNEEVDRRLREAIANDLPIVASTSVDSGLASKIGISNNPGEIPSSHVYTVVDYDAESKAVKLRNPWGSGGQYGEFFTLSLDEFTKYFSSMAVPKK